MFKIQDNADGSTSVYCKNSGLLLCTIPAKSNSNVPRRVNVVEPQPSVNTNEPSWHLLKKDRHEINELVLPKAEPCDEILTSFRESKCCLSPIPITLDGDQSEDYSDDCITEEAFAKCLDLVSLTRLQSQDRRDLLAEYPLRLLSRSRAYRTLQDLPDLKLPDYMPLTSYLGLKILELNQGRNFLGEQQQVLVKKYDNYCRFPFNAPKPSSCHFPKLRCREKKMYPITTSAKTLRHDSNHVYTYGRRQRRERMRVMETGLNKRGRRLLELCKKCEVRVKRLTKAEIKFWKKKKNIVPAVAVAAAAPVCSFSSHSVATFTSTCTNNFTDPGASCSTTLPTKSQVMVGPSFLKCDSHLPFLLQTPLTRKNRPFPSCSNLQRKSFFSPQSTSVTRTRRDKEVVIRLTNVIQCISFRNGHYVVRGTSISIPFYADFLKAVERRRKPRCNTNVRKDHAYASNMCLIPKLPIVAATPQTLKPDSCSMSRRSLEEGSSKSIPCIDLTGEVTPPKEDNSVALAVPKKLVAPRWRFHCFACGFWRIYCNMSNPARQAEADSAIRDHMRSYHSVVEPNCFLTKYLDRVNQCTIVEAFPGYKGS